MSRKGYSTDLRFNWIVEDHGEDWLQWQQYICEWMETQTSGLPHRMSSIRKFILYLVEYAGYSYDVASMFKGDPCGHKVSSDEFENYVLKSGMVQAYAHVNHVVTLCDFILDKHLSLEEDGLVRPLFANPFKKSKKAALNFETVHNPLPYRYIEMLRHFLCPYEKAKVSDEKPWLGHNFSDWKWAANELQGDVKKSRNWIEVNSKTIDKDDPDCIWRRRTILRRPPGKKVAKTIEIYEIWSPVVAMVLFVKLHLPLRTFQVRFLDSGEADTWRYVNGDWVKNKHIFSYGTNKRPYAKGVFNRIYDSMSERYTTGLYISTNKTSDQNKDDRDRGYKIPWEHEELLYWLEKLRNWQEKYNPIERPVIGTELEAKHTGVKSKEQLEAMGEFTFLFRDPGVKNEKKFPVQDTPIRESWHGLLSHLEKTVHTSGQTLQDGSRMQFVDNTEAKDRRKAVVHFPLHSLRVSLITCYTMDTDLPLPVISKLLAGHTRLLMTIYYNKITPSMMASKMKEVSSQLDAKSEESLKNFLADAEFNQIKLRTAYNQDRYDSTLLAISKRNPVGWEGRSIGLCLMGGNTINNGELNTLGGCWNGGPIIKDAANPEHRVYAPVPHGPENCVRCRWFVTDATYLDQLTSTFNQISYKAHQAAELAIEIEAELDSLKDELYLAEDQGRPFIKQQKLQELERRFERQRVEADEYAKDYIATFNLLKRIIEIENGREDDDSAQKLVAVGSGDDLNVSMRFMDTQSELLHLSLLCDDAECYPEIHDVLRKSPAIEKRNRSLSRMLAQSGYKPVFLEMDDKTAMIAGNAIMRKMALISNPDDKLEGFRTAANYIEAQEYLSDHGLLSESINALEESKPLLLQKEDRLEIPLYEVEE